ncbi:MAG: Mth938-like domain-containing protein [Chloroflexota bacterium]
MVTSPPEIQDFRFGSIRIDGQRYRSDVIIFPDRVLPNWWREEGHSLSVGDLAEVLVAPPRVLVIGCGTSNRLSVPQETKRHLEAQGIRVVIQSTAEACRSYNRYREKEHVVAALHLTC